MKYLPWLSVMVFASQSLIACSSDDEPAAAGGAAGSVASAGKGGDSASPAAGAPATAGAATESGGAGGSPAASAAGTANGESGAGGVSGSAGGPSATKDIIDTAVGAGTFTKLAAALTSAGLVETLKRPGPFTVFAPTDAAFAAFEAANPGVLAGLSKAQLTEILTYHVVAGAAIESKDLKDEQVFSTVSGSPVLIDTTGGVKVDDSKVTTLDVMASNGVIHVIDEILLPPKDDVVATAVANGMFSKLAGALTTAGLVPTLQGKGPFTVFAPTDAAFAKLSAVPSGNQLKDVLLYHVVAGAVGSGDLKAGATPTLLSGKSVSVALSGGVKINDAKVTTANVLARNGVIHIIDTVLIPQ